jgi:DNA-binding Xre family transcriptional regulator
MTEAARRYTVRFDLYTQIQRLRYVTRRRYTYAEVGERIGLHENTVQRMAAGATERIDFSVLEKLVNFFRAEGLADFTVNDLFVIEEVNQEAA